MSQLSPRDRLIVALDFASVAEAEAMVRRLGTAAGFYKVGLQLAYAEGGIAFAQRLAAAGNKVFLDVKLLDIDNTVAGAVRSIVGMGMTFVTVHAYPKAMRAAVEARGEASLRLLGVTVLTSMSDTDLKDAGYNWTAEDLAVQRAADARAAGMDGVVAAATEATALRRVVGPDMAIVTPGIRPPGSAVGDQKRLATPRAAIAAGADYLVVGRPITDDDDPLAAASAIIADIEGAQMALKGGE